MFKDDKLMTLLTGLVLAVVVGTLAQKSDSVMSFLGGESAEETQIDKQAALDEALGDLLDPNAAGEEPTPVETVAEVKPTPAPAPVPETEDDFFMVLAEHEVELDVLRNDSVSGSIVLLTRPECGTIGLDSTGALRFLASSACIGELSFKYCVLQEDSCDPHDVALVVEKGAPAPAAITETVQFSSVANPEDTGNAGNFGTVADASRLPGLPMPSADIGSQSTEALEALRAMPGEMAITAVETDTAIGVQSSGSAPSGFANPDASFGQQFAAGIESDAAVMGLGRSNDRSVSLASSLVVERSPSVLSSQESALIASNPAPVALLAMTGLPSVPLSTGGLTILPTELDDEPTLTAALSAQIQDESGSDAAAIADAPALVSSVRVFASPLQDQSGLVDDNSDIQIAPLPVGIAFTAALLTEGTELLAPSAHETAPVVDTRSFEIASLGPVAAAPIEEEVAAPAVADCEVELTGTAGSSAVASIVVASPCHAAQPVTISHVGLEFTIGMDANGFGETEVPLFEQTSEILATFDDGASASILLNARGIEELIRAGISWNSLVDLDLHAFEFGAWTNDPGHVWSGAAKSYREARLAGGGYHMMLGNPELPGAMIAEIYTLPLQRTTPDGIITLKLEVRDGTGLCGQNIVVATARSSGQEQASSRKLRFALPDCNGLTQQVFVNGLIDDLRVAQR